MRLPGEDFLSLAHPHTVYTWECDLYSKRWASINIDYSRLDILRETGRPWSLMYGAAIHRNDKVR